MKKKDYLRLILILAIFFIALGGWLLHLQLHEPGKDAEDFIPAVSGLLSAFIVPILFIFRSTIPFAYLITGMTAIIGTIAMTHFSIKNPPEVWTLQTVLFGTLLAEIAVLWGKFAVGKALFELDAVIRQPDTSMRRGRFFRFPNMGFWYVHGVTLTAVYCIGAYFWK